MIQDAPHTHSPPAQCKERIECRTLDVHSGLAGLCVKRGNILSAVRKRIWRLANAHPVREIPSHTVHGTTPTTPTYCENPACFSFWI
jgi:hypothetical protein